MIGPPILVVAAIAHDRNKFQMNFLITKLFTGILWNMFGHVSILFSFPISLFYGQCLISSKQRDVSWSFESVWVTNKKMSWFSFQNRTLCKLKWLNQISKNVRFYMKFAFQYTILCASVGMKHI